jgi:hypothetical protein
MPHIHMSLYIFMYMETFTHAHISLHVQTAYYAYEGARETHKYAPRLCAHAYYS